MPVKLLATNPFAEPARLDEPSPSPAMRAHRWKRPLGVLPQYLRPTATNNTTPRAPGHAGRSHTQGKPSDARQLFSMTQAATEHLKAAAQQGHREESRSCDLDPYRIGAPAYGVNNSNSHTNNTSPKSKTQLPNIKLEEGSRPGFEHRLGRQTYSRAEVLLKLQRRKKSVGKLGPAGTTGDGGGGQSQDLPVINMKEAGPCSCDVARVTNKRSDSGCHSKDSSVSKSQNSSPKTRRVSSTALVSRVTYTRDPDGSDGSLFSSVVTKGESNPKSSGPREETSRRAAEETKRKLGFVEVATPLHREQEASPDSDDEERSTGTSSPVVSNDVDSVCEELQKIVLRRAKHDQTCATPFGVRWREDVDESPDSDTSDKNRFDRAMQALQPPVPHVVWPANKYYSTHTVFVYAGPSRLAPVVIPSHSVDCPQCKFYQASPKGDVCPPNSPTPWMHKEYGFYPVERHFGSK